LWEKLQCGSLPHIRPFPPKANPLVRLDFRYTEVVKC